jgi:hypothetical protein
MQRSYITYRPCGGTGNSVWPVEYAAASAIPSAARIRAPAALCAPGVFYKHQKKTSEIIYITAKLFYYQF